MTKSLVSELKGPVLDFFVAKAATINGVYLRNGVPHVRLLPSGDCMYTPTTDWSIGGLLMWDEGIVALRGKKNACWLAGKAPEVISQHVLEEENDVIMMHSMCGSTQLEAGMRSFVSLKLGHYVDIPDALTRHMVG